MPSSPPQSRAAVTHAVHAMGTRFEFVLIDDRAPHARAAAEAAAEEVLRLHALWSPFEKSSVIAAINRDAAARPVRVDTDTFALLTLCQDIHARSGGAFDVTLGHLMRHHGWRDGGCDRPVWGSNALHLDAATHTVSLSAPVSLDLGAVAKGWALDAGAALLREAGITHALLHAGTSSVLAIGAPPGADAWRVRLSPQPDSPTVVLCDNALSVSAPHGRVHTDDPAHLPAGLSHTIDPRTGEPTARLLHATTIAPSAAVADAWSTALLVLGRLPPAADGVAAMVQSRSGNWSA